MLVGYKYLTVVLSSIPFGSSYHARTFIPRRNHLSINMVFNGNDPNNNLGIQRFSQRFFHLDILNILMGIKF